MSTVTAQKCQGQCGATIRRSTGGRLCKACVALAEMIFRRTHSPLDADWIRARNRFFGPAGEYVAAVLVERATVAA